MPESTSHGRPYIEPERHDELSKGVAAQAQASDQRRPDGTLAQGARTVPSLGGKAHKGRTRLSHVIEGAKLTEQSVKRARVLRRALSGEVSATVGGGHCGIAASLFLKFAAQKTAAAEEAFERGDFETHRKLSESARMDVLYAREHAAKEALARKDRSGPADPMAQIHARPRLAPSAPPKGARPVCPRCGGTAAHPRPDPEVEGECSHDLHETARTAPTDGASGGKP